MSDSDRPPQGATILVIENDDVTATTLHAELIGAGYVVQRVASGNAALVTLGSRRADLILMSLMLPDADGLALYDIQGVRGRPTLLQKALAGASMAR